MAAIASNFGASTPQGLVRIPGPNTTSYQVRKVVAAGSGRGFPIRVCQVARRLTSAFNRKSAPGCELDRPSGIGRKSSGKAAGARGYGKTRALSGTIHLAVRAGYRRMHLVCPSFRDVVDVMVDGPSSILATAPPGERPRWVGSRHRVEFDCGAG